MKVEMKFHGMTCLECAQNLEKALRSVPGVESAEVS
jgi:copper chaperone CopZ